jgi:PKD repeat protein
MGHTNEKSPISVTSEIINVLIAIDTETILNKYGTNSNPDQPIQITQPNLIYMIVRRENAISGQAGKELIIGAQVLDSIRWRATTLSLNSKSEVILYKFIASSGMDFIENPHPLIATVKVPLPNPDDPIRPTIQEIKSYFYSSVVLEQGTVTYHFYFSIMDWEGIIQGYFWWDTSMKITDPTVLEKPIANFSANITRGDAPLVVLFTDQSTGGAPTSWLWNTGDGIYSRHAMNATHTFTKPGVYNVTLTVENEAGNSTVTKPNYITVTPPQAPLADFAADITSGSAPLKVHFTSTTTGNPIDYFWVFEPSTSSDWNSHHAVTAVHTFKKPGTYTISLTVTNNAGSTTVTKTKYITVT